MPRRVRATPDRITRLIAEANAVSGEPAGAHLGDEQFVQYAADPPLLSDADTLAVEAHLETCDECLAQLEEFIDALASWNGHVVDSSTEGGSAVVRLSDWLRDLPRYPAALPAAAAAPLERESPAATDHVFIGDDGAQNLRIIVSSYNEALLGARVSVEPFGVSFVLERVAPDQVGGKVVIPKSERARHPLDAVVRLIVDPPSEI